MDGSRYSESSLKRINRIRKEAVRKMNVNNATYSTFTLGKNEYKRVEINKGEKVIWLKCFPNWREDKSLLVMGII